MNSDLESGSRKKRKRSESYSSSDRSRSRSRSRDRKKTKKDKKRKRSRSRSKGKRKRSRSQRKRGRRKDRRERSRSRSESASEEKQKYLPTIPPMDPQMMSQYMYYPPPIMGTPRDPRMVRPPIFYPTYPNESYMRPIRHPIAPIIPAPKMAEQPQILEPPPDKIVKDQNFLNSDEKLFESIVNNEINIRSIFEDAQISENYAGSTLYKTVKKILHDPNTIIFDSDKSVKSGDNNPPLPKQNEIVTNAINSYLLKNSYNKVTINMGDMSQIKEQLLNYKKRVEPQEIN